MLADIKRYLVKREGLVSLQELATHFDVEPDRMHFMLSHWIKKGRVTKYQNNICSNAGGCNGCASKSAEYYVWQAPLSGGVVKIAAVSA